MPYEWVDHTAEVQLEIDAASDEDAFAEATAALGELLGRPGDRRTTRELAVEAGDRASQLVAWLEELVFLAEMESFVAVRLIEIDLDGRRAGVVEGGDAPATYLVKAVTYHGLRFEREGDRVRATVVLDV
jgi:SHS2 domain-containing protein